VAPQEIPQPSPRPPKPRPYPRGDRPQGSFFFRHPSPRQKFSTARGGNHGHLPAGPAGPKTWAGRSCSTTPTVPGNLSSSSGFDRPTAKSAPRRTCPKSEGEPRTLAPRKSVRACTGDLLHVQGPRWRCRRTHRGLYRSSPSPTNQPADPLRGQKWESLTPAGNPRPEEPCAERKTRLNRHPRAAFAAVPLSRDL